MPAARQVIGGRQPARSRADDQHAPARTGWRRGERPAVLAGEVAQEPLDRVDRDGAVEVGAVADALARVVTDPPVYRRKRVVGDELTPGLIVASRGGMTEPRLDVLPCGTVRVAGRQHFDVDRLALAHRPRPRPTLEQIWQRRDAAMATAAQTAHTPPRGADRRVRNSAARVRERRRRAAVTAPEHVIDQTHWQVTADGTVTDVFSRAHVWRDATAAYSPGHPVVVDAA